MLPCSSPIIRFLPPVLALLVATGCRTTEFTPKGKVESWRSPVPHVTLQTLLPPTSGPKAGIGRNLPDLAAELVAPTASAPGSEAASLPAGDLSVPLAQALALEEAWMEEGLAPDEEVKLKDLYFELAMAGAAVIRPPGAEAARLRPVCKEAFRFVARHVLGREPPDPAAAARTLEQVEKLLGEDSPVLRGQARALLQELGGSFD
jgi:hypothetical protein